MELSTELIKKLQQNLDFKEFAEWMAFQVKSLDTVAGLSNLDNTTAGEEAKVRLLSGELLKSILAPVVNFAEKARPNETKIMQMKARTGLN